MTGRANRDEARKPSNNRSLLNDFELALRSDLTGSLMAFETMYGHLKGLDLETRLIDYIKWTAIRALRFVQRSQTLQTSALPRSEHVQILEMVPAMLRDDMARAEIIHAMSALGRAFWEAGAVSDAVPLLRDALFLAEKADLEAPSLLRLVSDSAMALRASRRFEEAEIEARRALQMATDAFGDRAPERCDYLSNLGLVLLDRGDPAGAERCFREALAIDEADAGDEHRSVAVRWNNLGAALLRQGRHDAARDALARALDLDRRRGDAAAVANGHANLAIIELAAEKLDRARLHIEMAERTAKEALSADHPDRVAIEKSHRKIVELQEERNGN